MVYRAAAVADNAPITGDNDSDSPMLQKSEPTAADTLQSLIRDCGLSKNKLHELLEDLPGQQFTDALIDYFFTTM